MIKRKKPPNRERKTPVAKLRKTLWREFAAAVRERDHHICVTCGGPATQAGHFFSRGIASLWVDPRNVHAQCGRCNLFLHGNPGAYSKYIVDVYGVAELERLTKRASQVTKKWERFELEHLIRCLRDGGLLAYELAYYGD